MKLAILAALAALIAVAAVSLTPSGQAASDPNPVPAFEQPIAGALNPNVWNAEEKSLATKINDFRANLRPARSKLTLSNQMGKVANAWCNKVKNNFAVSTAELGPILNAYGVQWRNAGENRNRTGTDATDVFSQWKSVRSTKTVMKQSAWTSMGIGNCTKNGVTYWVAVFVQP